MMSRRMFLSRHPILTPTRQFLNLNPPTSQTFPGVPGGDQGVTAVSTTSRAFPTNARTGAYSLIVRPPAVRPAGPVFVTVSAVGDDGKTPIPLKSARLAPKGGPVPIAGSARIGPVAFPPAGPLRLEVVLEHPRRLSLQVTTHAEAASETE